ncbi:MAG: DUF3179 domain-containing (seleno)protein [Saprospiraceae bacterium]
MKKYSLLLLTLFILACGNDEEDTVPNNNPSTTTTYSGLVHDTYQDHPIVVVGMSRHNFATAYHRTLSDGTVLDFTFLRAKLPNIMEDNEGNIWNIFGIATEGPRKGEQLKILESYFGLWFSWSTMFPGAEIYGEVPPTVNFVPEINDPEWTIPTTNVIAVLGQDAIPSIDEPVFENYDNREFIETGEYFLDDEDVVIGVWVNDELRLYPHRILNWHEVVNDKIGDTYISVSFCPLTATSVAWERDASSSPTTFGVSGLLYNSNVIVYDRESESLWSQMKGTAVKGNFVNEKFKQIPLIEARWGLWKTMYEEPAVLTTDTGFGKDYTINPYESYLETEGVLSYPVDYTDDRLPLKEKVYGVNIDGNVKVYQFKDLIN